MASLYKLYFILGKIYFYIAISSLCSFGLVDVLSLV